MTRQTTKWPKGRDENPEVQDDGWLQRQRDDSPDFDLDAEEETVAVAVRPARPAAVVALIDAAFHAATTPQVRRRLKSAKAVAVMVVVPTAAWINPTESWFFAAYGKRWQSITRDGRSRSLHQASQGNFEIATWLADGLCVVGISADAQIMPAALLAAADITIRISPPNSAVLRRTVASFTGSAAPAVDGAAVGLDIADIVGALRPGSGARAICARLSKAARAVVVGGVPSAVDDVPDLSGAVEWGSARQWGLELAKGIKSYKEGSLKWSELPRGLVLTGQPGTGKTLFASSLARACGVPIITTSVGQLFAGDRGHLDDVIRGFGAFMDDAQRQAPAIALIDECEAIPNRFSLGQGGRGNADYWRPFVNYVLTRLDDSLASTRNGIIVIGATNDASDLDPALIRPGRLERIIEIELPDETGALNILRFHAPEIDVEELRAIAPLAEGTTGAAIMYAVREARRIARGEGRPLSASDIRAVMMPDHALSDAAEQRLCLHEAGHAVAGTALGIEVRGVVIGRGDNGAGGRTTYGPDSSDLMTLKRVERQVIVSLAGRSAERIVLGACSAGAGGVQNSDLAIATRLMALVHASAGLGDTVAYLSSAQGAQEAMMLDIDIRRRVERDLQRLQTRADELIGRHRAAVEAVAGALRDRRHLPGNVVRELVAAHPPRGGTEA